MKKFLLITLIISLLLIIISVLPSQVEEVVNSKPISEDSYLYFKNTSKTHFKTIPEKECEYKEWAYDDNLKPEENIFIYLTDYLGFPASSACGIISNIAHETGWKFNPKAGSSSYCYGLIQWMGGRLSNLKRYCRENDKDYTTIQGQLDFMYYEMSCVDTYGTYDYLMSCEESAQGAYDAAWYFCFWYERPANTRARSNLRASEAMDYYEALVLNKD